MVEIEKWLEIYHQAMEREFLCGFVAGKEELESWDPADRFQFFFDTVPVYGKLEDLISKPSRCHAKQAALTGACNLYHGCSHNYLHTRNPDILAALIPSVRKG